MTDVPRPPRRPHVWQRPTGAVDDPYAWMRDLDDPDLDRYLRAENGYATKWFAEHADLVGQLFTEIRSRIQETDLSVPVRSGPWWYTTATDEGASYPRHLRGPSSAQATDQLLLDENVEADGRDHFDVGAFDVSFDHRLLAWSFDTTGDERYTLRIRDLDAGNDRDDRIDGIANAGTAWSADGRFVFYVTADDQQRPCTVWRHELGTPTSTDQVVFDEPDESFYVGVGATRSERWIVVSAASLDATEMHILDAATPTERPLLIQARRPGVEYTIDDWGDRWVMLTNEGATDFRVLQSTDDVAEWHELVAHRTGERIIAVDAFADFLALLRWSDGLPHLALRFRDGTEREIHGLAEPSDIDLAANPEWNTSRIRFTMQSMTAPPALYDEQIDGSDRRLLKQVATPNVDLAAYESVRRWAIADDGARIPVDVVGRGETAQPGPTLVTAYGAYEVSLPPRFSVARLSLLDRGVRVAVAHPRGGGELGRAWYEGGRRLNKRNTFTDTLACVDELVAAGIADPRHIGLRGGSAGGLLVGACVTMQPERFRAAVAEVPFVDVVTTMSDPSLPLTVTEWDEWGDPRAEPYASYIESYSPYDHTTPAAYPAVYVSAGLHDPRVSVHEPAKWIARLRDVNTSDRPLLLVTEMGAGHLGPSGRYDAWRDEARILAFLLTTL
ncbi:MAG: S9 family peptidase [Actinomycetota bacterium]